LHAYQRAGGDLYAAWFHHFPHDELALIRAAQLLGNQAVVQTLGHLSSALRLVRQAVRILHSSLWPAAMAGFIVMAMSLAIPWFTVPQLLATFSGVPVDYYGTLTHRLIKFSGFIDRHYLTLI